MTVKSFNHQYIEYSEEVYSRYTKAVVAAVCGVRLDPRTKIRIEFMIKSNWGKFDIENETITFDYDTDVVEIYSQEEDRIFKVLNRVLFEGGMLVPYVEKRDDVDMSSALSDDELTELAAIKNLLQFKKQIKEISSKPTLQRLSKVVETTDRPISFAKAIEERMKEV